jgi:protein-tyrosine-phosphatase
MTEMIDEERNIDDPVLGTEKTYRATVQELEDIINRGFEKILKRVTKP